MDKEQLDYFDYTNDITCHRVVWGPGKSNVQVEGNRIRWVKMMRPWRATNWITCRPDTLLIQFEPSRLGPTDPRGRPTRQKTLQNYLYTFPR